jgi:hypothetical protein
VVFVYSVDSQSKIRARHFTLDLYTSLPNADLLFYLLQEISDDLMEAMTNLIVTDIPPEAESAQKRAYVTYSYPQHLSDGSVSHERAVTLLEARSVISFSGTTGLRTWEPALLLGSYLVSETGRASIHGKRLFEVGAGTGMLSILCAKHLGVAGVVATDGDEAVVDAIKTNLFLNGLDANETLGCQVRTAALKWGRRVDATTFSEDYGMEVPDIVVGADVVSCRHYMIVEMWAENVADL